MNAPKPQPLNPQPAPAESSPPATRPRRRDSQRPKSGEQEAAERADVDFERHDTIPAPAWFDDPNDTNT